MKSILDSYIWAMKYSRLAGGGGGFLVRITSISLETGSSSVL